MDKPIIMADTDEIDCYADLAEEFLDVILDLCYDECFISDETQLADFSGCGTPDEPGVEIDDWDTYIVNKIDSNYGVTPAIDDTLVKIFESIIAARNATRQ